MPTLASNQPCTRGGRRQDHEFATMSRMFDAHGSMLTAEELVQSLRTNVAQPLSIVARWIARRGAVHFTWRSRTWFPCFQFARNPMSILPAVSVIILELRDAYDDLELALWFVRRNEWLDHASPVEAIQCDAAAAVRAARIDGFVANG